MRIISDILFRIRSLLLPEKMDRELANEFAFHLEKATEKYIAEGMNPADARRQALIAFGGMEKQKEFARDSWGVNSLRDLGSDVRFALRQLRKNPLFAGLATATLALGIGGAVALFSVVSGLMLKPLPYDDEGRIMTFWSFLNWRGQEFDFVRERVRAYEHIAAYGMERTTLRSIDATRMVRGIDASSELFDVLGAHPFLGRAFSPGEDRPGAEPVVVISHSLWQNEFSSDRSIVGESVTLGDKPTTVIGVMPQGFYFPSPEFDTWRPMNLDPSTRDYRSNGRLALIGRMRDDITPMQLDEDLASLTAALGEEFTYPAAWDKTKGAFVLPIRDFLFGDMHSALLLLQGAVGLLLLMACVNVSALILSRTVDRTGEMALRMALGAGRGRLARQVLTEGIVLGFVSGVGALLLAVGMFDALVARLPLQNGLGATLSLDWMTLTAATGLALGAGVAVAVIPLWSLMRGKLAGEISGERRPGGGTGGESRVHGMLVATEVLLAVMLVTGASLLVRTVTRLRDVDIGIEPDGVVAVDLVTGVDAMDDAQLTEFYRRVMEDVPVIPGVMSAALTNRLPLRDGGWQGTVNIESRTDLSREERPNSLWRTVTPDYFATLGIQLTAGRFIDESDIAGRQLVGVVNETFARTAWPGEDPVGKRFAVGLEGRSDWITVVGVATEPRMLGFVGENPMTIFFPHAQLVGPNGNDRLIFKTASDPLSLVPAVRDVVSRIDSRVAVANPTTMNDVIDSRIAEPLRLRFFLTLFGALGLMLGAVGVYGVVSYAVTRRRTEFGIRTALGAGPWVLVNGVLRRGMTPVLIGTVLGVAGSLALSRLLAGFLFEVAPNDPISILAAAVLLVLVGVTACWIPARRASKVSPMESLRAE